MSSVTGTAPPLTWWGHTWRLLLVLAVTALTWAELGVWQLRHAPLWFVLDVTVGVLCTVLAVARPAWPWSPSPRADAWASSCR